MTSISGQISFRGVTIKESISQGKFSKEVSLKKGNSFNGFKVSITPNAGPSIFSRLKPLPLPFYRKSITP